MTTLRTFQNEIDEQSREIAKQRAAQAVAEKEKENKKPPPTKGKSKDDAPDPAPPDTTTGLFEIEEKILTALLSTPTNHDLARGLALTLN